MAGLPGKQFAVNLFERRGLLMQLVRRDFERRFVGSTAGWLWGVIHPLVLLLCWTFVFNHSMGLRVPAGQKTDNYSLFLWCGMLPWLLFQETVARSSTAMLENANLITKTVFPSEMIPVAIFCSSLVNHVLSLALAVGAVMIWGNGLSWLSLWVPVFVLLLGLFSVGVGWLVASLNVYLRDTAQLTAVVLSLGMWLTPVFVTVADAKGVLKRFLMMNPLTPVVDAYRAVLLNGAEPSGTGLLVAAAAAVAVFVAGGLVFRQLKPGFADVL